MRTLLPPRRLVAKTLRDLAPAQHSGPARLRSRRILSAQRSHSIRCFATSSTYSLPSGAVHPSSSSHHAGVPEPFLSLSTHSRSSAKSASASASSPSSSHPTSSAPSPTSSPTTSSSVASDCSGAPFKFNTGYALFPKRTPRPFPPPFNSPPSGSFSDPLSTHDRIRDRSAAKVNGQFIRGLTNGDDAVYVSERMLVVNDGVGAWSTREGGHAGLWSRLLLHFWSLETESQCQKRNPNEPYTPQPIECLQRAYEQTIAATSKPNKWSGTTTAAGAQLHFQNSTDGGAPKPLLYVTNLGDSQIMVVRPSQQQMIFKTTEQWHWFDCPRQLGTNSPDTPVTNAVLDVVEIQEGDVVLAVSDGVIDNLWEHEIVENVAESVFRWENDEMGDVKQLGKGVGVGGGGEMQFVAEQLLLAAKKIAQDPFAESPFMERAVEEGLAMEGGKMDDISVIAAICCKT